MLVRKNYYLYEENDEKQPGKLKLLGSVRLTRNGEQWTMEIQWRNESEAEVFVSKAGEGEVQLRIREKEIILGQWRSSLSNRQDQESNTRIIEAQSLTEELKEIEERKAADIDKAAEIDKVIDKDIEKDIDQEWEQVRRSCHRVEACRELGEAYRVNKGDFAVLPESVKHILQNSFLVHGLMNYGYLLLFCADEKLKQLGVGVPGVYYEKEKLVAEMFGFPQFWCDGKSNNGKFGYYLRIMS